MTKCVLITGITGMDGSHLADLLVSKGYDVHGLIRRASSFHTGRIDHLYKDPHSDENSAITLHYGDMADTSSLRAIIEKVEPDDIYNLAAQSHVRVSFDMPEYTGDVTGMGALRLFEAIRQTGAPIRTYHASSSEMFGSSPPPQRETTPFHPRSPYGCAKVFAYHAAVNYREAYGLYIANGILFNHESERRSETFVTRKITRAVGRIVHRLQSKLYLGNLDARRDWGAAEDYVDAMRLMLQADKPDDYVIGTGRSHSVREFVRLAFRCAGIDDWHEYVVYDPRYDRPTEIEELRADASKAHKRLGWAPKTTLEQMVQKMVDHDLELAKREREASGR